MIRKFALTIALLITLYTPSEHEALAESPTASLDELSRFEIDKNIAEMRKLTDFERIKRLRIAEHEAKVKRIKAERQAEAERLAEASRKERARLAREEAERERAKTTTEAKAILTVEATFYGPDCSGCSGITATGDNVRNSIYVGGRRVIAVDPRVIPLRSIVRVTLSSGESFEAVASDTGGKIRGRIIDVLVSSEAESYRHGRQTATVEILREGGG